MVEPLIIILIALSIVWIAFVVLAFFFKIFKTILKVFFIINLVLFLASGVFGYLLYRDFIDLKENFPIQEKLFLLKEGDRYLAGFSAKELAVAGSKLNTEQTPENSAGFPAKPLTEAKLASYSGKKLPEVLEERYKIIVVNADMFKKVKRIKLPEGLEFTGNELVSLIKKDDSFRAFAGFMADEIMKKQGIPLSQLEIERKGPGIDKQQIIRQIKASFDIKDEQSFDSLVLMFMIIGSMQEQGPIFLVEQFKAGNIAVYPETLIFKSVKLIPNKAFEFAAQKLSAS